MWEVEELDTIYKGDKGKLLLIADILYDYDNCKTEKQLKELIDEVREIAIKQLKEVEEDE